MKKKVKKWLQMEISGDMRMQYKGSNGDKEIKKQLQLHGFDTDRLIYQRSDYKNLSTIYSQETVVEVEDFETMDHNRYEYYLNEVLDKYILKSETIGLYTTWHDASLFYNYGKL